MPKIINPLAKLPIHIRPRGKKGWYYDYKLGKAIHPDHIHKHIPKPTPSQTHEQIIAKRWDLQK